ncbi:N-formyl-4-amino-5-aminomethyl-2-methylpyrimidine deformylase [Capillimicrobium parvum]|uniref:N-formyl-4-amino-5-aminomethyl-2-methylpyrimidine deformylase n=2 Tax=Capillimicrobium parvum TaxID=2884022 RepID=A0A9E6XVG6_9ACTN|nr:N-formyl-4-amino-5-aminomethyl-2-methylpyrimidine deformylase [Capillimicrobium parvum]
MQEMAHMRADGAFDEAYLVGVLRSLVRAQSVNPGIYEAAMAQAVQRALGGLPLEVSVVEFAPGRPSVGAVLRGSGDGPRLVLNGHMDTVPIDDADQWTKDPFGGEVCDGFLYGRGACDMKAGLAVQVAVARYLAAHRERLRGDLVLHFAAGEELGEPGTLSLLEAGLTGDYGITTEPTGLRVATATRGLAFIRIRVHGRSIHASRAQYGVNPVSRLAPVLAVIEEYSAEVATRGHPLLSSGSCTPTLVTGGVKENAVADYCELTLDRRMLPSEDGHEELEVLRARLEAIKAHDPDFAFDIRHLVEPWAGTEIDPGSAFAQRVVAAVGAVTGEPGEIYGAPFGSDVRNLVNDAGIEAVTFGPGNIVETHCADERVSVEQLRQAAWPPPASPRNSSCDVQGPTSPLTMSESAVVW